MRSILLYSVVLLAALSQGQETSGPWSKAAVLEPASLAATLRNGKAPVIISVAFPVLYHSRHIVHAIYAGPGSKAEGIAALKKAVAEYPKNSEIVIYCGCCPMGKCPNIRPAFRALAELGFTRVRVLNIPTNMHTDWYSKDYPSESKTI